MTASTTWESIYAQGAQLNQFPYSEAVSYFMRRWANGVPDQFAALDVGCGSGVHAALFASRGAQVTAFDFSASAIAAALAMFPDPRIQYQTASFDEFDPGPTKFDFVFDRLSTTHSSMTQVERFYQNLRPALSSGAQLFWQGFDWDNSGRDLGTYDAQNQRWQNFSGGVFEHLGPTVFFQESDLARVFDGYQIDKKRILSDRDIDSGYSHSYWMLELSVA